MNHFYKLSLKWKKQNKNKQTNEDKQVGKMTAQELGVKSGLLLDEQFLKSTAQGKLWKSRNIHVHVF